MISGIMIADILIYSTLAWYFGQIVPSSVGVAKPWYFIFQKSYWFDIITSQKDIESTREVLVGDVELNEGSRAPTEEANENLLGKPTIRLNNISKTFGSTSVVNNLSFSMYENQIFALLGKFSLSLQFRF